MFCNTFVIFYSLFIHVKYVVCTTGCIMYRLHRQIVC